MADQPRDVLKRTIAQHQAEIARLQIVLDERAEARRFAQELFMDAFFELREERAALADALDALADLKRAERKVA